ncbi:MAG: phytanoyl-CoA dioxygenase family protein, partial [Phycisphaeraceae bacterium]|nr:phytanoyl-CoA dioxygenase family protein [Phycisphaeraceae bacterium]
MSTPMPSAEQSNWLTNSQRDELVATFHRDGHFQLPVTLPDALRRKAVAAIDRHAAEEDADGPTPRAVKQQGCVQKEPAFRPLMMFPPVLQMCHDLLGPVFQLNQSNFYYKPREEAAETDFAAASPWHADGPRPRNFPPVETKLGPAVGLHYLKFAFFLTDLTHEGSGPLEVIRGSHRRPELDGLSGDEFDPRDYGDDYEQLNVPAGTIVAFHQAQWHASPPNQSDIVRKNLYISFCPTWMRPFDYDMPRQGELS